MLAVVFHTLLLYSPHSLFINRGSVGFRFDVWLSTGLPVFINVKASGVFNDNIDVSLLAGIYNILF